MPEKYRNADAVVLVHDESARILRLDPKRFDDKAEKEAKRAGWRRYETPKDGFRARRKRTKADMKRLIDEGAVATEPQPPQTYSAETFVVEVPVGTLDGRAQEVR